MNDPTSGQYNANLPALTDGQQARLQLDPFGRLITTSGSGTPGATGGNTQTVQQPEDGVAVTKSSVTTTNASASLLAADSTRKLVSVSSAPGNTNPALIDISGGTASATSGIPLMPGGTLKITGKQAQSAMTQFGLSGVVLTVYVGS